MKKSFGVAAMLGLGLMGTVLVGTAQANEGEALTKKYGCVACHAVDKKMVGPAYKDVAAKYATDKDAVTKLSAKVINGGAGVWGQIPMPPHKGRVTDAEAKKMAEYVLKLK